MTEYLSKGSPLLVEGRLNQNSWERDGEKRSSVEVIADRVVFLGSKKDNETNHADDPATEAELLF